ncbi:MAG: hypothetical protein IJA61_03790 [Clostridia bacterium]|nr:hypothetical protein [Clostridia bacterium]
MKIGDITEQFKNYMQVRNYGHGLYLLGLPAVFDDGGLVTVAVKLEQETDVVLEREEEAESLALLSTSDEFEIRDLGSVYEKFADIDNIKDIIANTCEKYHVKFDGANLSLEADIDSAITMINRYLKCVFEIESKVKEVAVTEEPTQSNERTAKLMEYINNRKSNE